MPVDYARDDERRLIKLITRPPLLLDEVQGAIDRQLGENTWHYGLLVDARQATLSLQDSGALFAHIRELVAAHGRHGPVALVTRNFAGVGSSQMLSFHGGELNLAVEVFWDVQDAMEWLTSRTVDRP